jgi:hypothetical protein
LGPRFDQVSPDIQQLAQLPALGCEYMCQRNSTFFDRSSQYLRIDPISLSTVPADPELLASGRVDQQHLITPANQQIVHVPGFSARFDGHRRRRLLGAQERLEALHVCDRRALHDSAVGDFAIRGLFCAQIQCYFPHG